MEIEEIIEKVEKIVEQVEWEEEEVVEWLEGEVEIVEKVQEVFVEEEEEEESESEPEVELEPIIKVEEVIEEEIIYTENKELEEREKTLLRQRRLIELYKQQQADGQVGRQDSKDMQEMKLHHIVSDLYQQLEAFKKKARSELEYGNQAINLKLNMNNSRRLLEDAESVVKTAVDAAEELMKEDPEGDNWTTLHDVFMSALDALDLVPILAIPGDEAELFTLSSVIGVPGEGCKGKKYIVQSVNNAHKKKRKKKKKRRKKKKKKSAISYEQYANLLSEDDVVVAARDLIGQSEEVVNRVIASENLKTKSIKWFMHFAQEKITAAQRNRPDVKGVQIASTDNLYIRVADHGFSSEDVQTFIDKALEIDMSDSTGQYDFASIGNGARVIRSGTRKTSFSLNEHLPLINRFLSKASLKFYGHGAEAALLPTFPRNALGQCWSFEQEGVRRQLAIKQLLDEQEIESIDMDPDRGEYATLSVSFARPIHVESVIIEHPSNLLSAESQVSAIREFRLIGFINKEARGNPWLLGSFEYQTGE